MPRSRLVDLFRRAYLISRISAKSNLPVAEAEGVLQEKLSRRRVLQAGVAMSGVLGLKPNVLPRIWGPRRDVAVDSKVLVVGAGIAGLTAAYRLHQAGVPVDVVEASARLGGRLRSINQLPGSPSTVELGGEFIDTRHTYVRSLAAELGLSMADLRSADVGLEPEVLYFRGQRVKHQAVVEAFAPLAAKITQDLQTLGSRDITYQDPSPHALQLDQLSLAEYLEAADVDPLIDQLVRVAYVTEFGRDAEDQSCLNMLFLIGTEVGKWSTYGVSDERWHVIGGNERIPQALAAYLQDQIQMETALESLRMTPDGRYRVSLRQGATSQERTYERVLLTIPFSVLRLVDLEIEMPPVKQEAIAQLGYGTCTKLAIPFKERIWRSRYGSTVSVYTDLDFQNTWESARYSGGPSGWVTNLRGGHQGVLLGAGEAENHANALTADLNTVFPGMSQVSRGKALRAFWAAEPYVFGSYSCYQPGQWTTFGGSEAERVGNVWFAGEHCSLGSQGYMNGACESAEVAVQSILQDLGVRVSLV